MDVQSCVNNDKPCRLLSDWIAATMQNSTMYALRQSPTPEISTTIHNQRRLIVLKQHTDALAMMDSSDGLDSVSK